VIELKKQSVFEATKASTVRLGVFTQHGYVGDPHGVGTAPEPGAQPDDDENPARVRRFRKPRDRRDRRASDRRTAHANVALRDRRGHERSLAD